MTGTLGRKGIALPFTIFIITLMTIALAAAFARVGAEREMALGAGETVNALTVAQSGLQRYLGSRTTRPPEGDSTRYNVTGGYADVVARIVHRPPVDTLENWTYIIRSTGYIIVPVLGATAQAQRAVAEFAVWEVGQIRRVAAFTAINGVRTLNGGTISIDGTDFCNDSVPTVSLRTPAGVPITRGSYNPSYVQSGTSTAVADTTAVDWAAIVGGDFLPDYGSVAGGTPWASHLVQGDATLVSGTVGTGLLIVTGDLTTTGNFGRAEWYGVVLVGGQIVFNARTTRLRGLVISGLNQLLGGPPPPQGSIGGNAGSRYEIDYASCYVAPTVARLGGFAPVRNAWLDNWASY